MAQSFNCPHCGGDIQVEGTQQTARCSYCNKEVAVPEQFWRQAVTAQTTRRWGKYLLIFLAITVGLPTCIGLVAGLIGVGVSIVAAILPFLLAIFGQ